MFFYSATAHMSMKRSGMRMALLETQQCDSTHEHEAQRNANGTARNAAVRQHT
ncbi:MAG: hypothetical protein MRZ36_08685 [Eubacterium sp.]|nr:hypothetical protein [Eubacterium sp.]